MLRHHARTRLKFVTYLMVLAVAVAMTGTSVAEFVHADTAHAQHLRT